MRNILINNKNKIKFKDLSVVTSKIINKYPNISRVAMEYLHPRNTHPQSLKIYKHTFKSYNKYYSFFINLIKSLAILILAIYRNEKMYFGDKMPQKIDILFISHLTNIEQLKNSNEDNYFGEIINILSNGSYLVPFVTLINHTWLTENVVKKIWVKSKFGKIVLSRTNNLFSELKYIVMLLRESKNIRDIICLKERKRNIINHACCNALSPSSIMALRTYFQVRKIIKIIKPQYLVTTYEGHSWERLVFHAAKQENINIKCIGFQHSILFPNQYSIFRIIKGYFNPDIILTPGKISYEWFANKNISKFCTIKIIGTPRKLIIKKSLKNNLHQNAILVIPEGIKSETYFLFSAVINIARKLNKRSFILRVHPLLNIENFQKIFLKKGVLPSNIEWSSHSFEYDLLRSSVAIYRGSSSIISACLNGLYPIYYSKLDDFESIDPLFLINKDERTAFSENDLINKIIAFENINIADKNKIILGLKKYCSNYFEPFSYNNFLKILKLDNQKFKKVIYDKKC